MFQLLVEGWHFIDLVDRAIDPHALKAALLLILEFLLVFALAATGDRRQQIEPGALRQGHDAIDHLADRLAFDRQTCRW